MNISDSDSDLLGLAAGRSECGLVCDGLLRLLALGQSTDEIFAATIEANDIHGREHRLEQNPSRIGTLAG